MKNFLLIFYYHSIFISQVSSAIIVKLKDGTEISIDNLNNNEQNHRNKVQSTEMMEFKILIRKKKYH
jgi:hypothetical protein